MITILDQDKNFDKYNVIFRNAWKDLSDRGWLKPADAESNKTMFSDLAHYFAYIGDLASIDPIYLMLPIDEAPFEIDANTRTIKVPSDFAKCSGVQSDNYSEIVTFTIDRYFDYKDLAEAKIAVQWINEASDQKGVSFIQLIDLKTYGDENKIRFGWPLTAEMTAAAGNLRFAVRFYTTSTDENNKTVFNYIFNTTVASIPIKRTLTIDFDGKNVVKKDNDYNLFKSYINNSQNPSYGIPTQVIFANIPEELPVEGQISLEDDTLVLKAQAWTKDMNPIEYEWYRKREWKENDQTVTEIVKLDSTYSQYAIEDEVFELYQPQEWPTTRPNEPFWVDAENGKKTPFLGAGWPDADPKNLYSRKTTLTFVPKTPRVDEETGEITGYDTPNGYKDIEGVYFVKGINKVVSDGEVINKVYTDSEECKILIPADITIITDLQSHMFLDDKTDTLSMSIKVDEANPQRFYNVYYSKEKFDEDSLKDKQPEKDADGNELIAILDGKNDINYPLTAGKFGYYMIQPISKLNRVEKTKASALCYVSDHPGKPLGTMLINGKNPLEVDDNDDNIPDTSGRLDDNVLFEWTDKTNTNSIQINATGESGQTITLQVTPTIKDGTDFNTGAITYKWTKTLEGITEEILGPGDNESDIKGIDFETGLLTLRVLKPETGIYNYDCIISNTIENETNESERYSFTIV